MAETDQLGADVKRRWPAAWVEASQLSACLARGADEPADLYLAAAASRREPWALAALEAHVFTPVSDRLAHRHGRAAAQDAMQQVREQLLVSADGLSTYSGRGPLKAWVVVIAARKLLALRSEGHESLSRVMDAASHDDLELTLLRARYASVFKRALEQALDSLERRERLVLRMHTVDGLSAEKIGAIFHAHRATASQWISQARATLHERVVHHVRQEAGLNSSELDSIGRVLQRHTDFSLPRLLAGREVEAP